MLHDLITLPFDHLSWNHVMWCHLFNQTLCQVWNGYDLPFQS